MSDLTQQLLTQFHREGPYHDHIKGMQAEIAALKQENERLRDDITSLQIGGLGMIARKDDEIAALTTRLEAAEGAKRAAEANTSTAICAEQDAREEAKKLRDTISAALDIDNLWLPPQCENCEQWCISVPGKCGVEKGDECRALHLMWGRFMQALAAEQALEPVAEPEQEGGDDD